MFKRFSFFSPTILFFAGIIILLLVVSKTPFLQQGATIQKSTQKDFNNWIQKTKTRCSGILERNLLDTCYRGILQEAVKEEGTKNAVVILELLRSKGVIDAKFDDHQHIHEIGRATAKIKGLTVEAFNLCPSTYNYGCQHGFFEYVLSNSNSYKEAAEKICENIGKNTSPKLYSYCYHGVGHGVMMGLAYDLYKSLDICNQFKNQTAIEGCWQGTFMENTNQAVTNEENVRFISKTDPLYPCNSVEEKYQWQCYINHAGYLMKRTNMSIPKATKICLSAPKNGASPCIQSIGLMVTNPIWQKVMRGIDTILNPKKNVEISWSMCQEMPKEAQRDCVIGAVGNIHNFDEKNTSRSSLFCELVNIDFKHDCYAQIGMAVSGLTVNIEDAQAICQKLNNQKGQESCLSGVSARLFLEKNATFLLSKTDEQRLIQDNIFLKELLKKYKPEKVTKKLAEVMPAYNVSCHDRAHETGRFSYELFGADAFRLCSSECHSGCYHGATEAFFNDKGTANLEENLNLICQGNLNKFFKHQCVHGIGHGLMAWTNYELFEALRACDTLPDSFDQSSCWTGVFMENIVGGLVENKTSAHFTKYLDNNPHYPCTIVDEKYKGACYFLQTSRMEQLFKRDFQKVADACADAPEKYRISCFQSMGRDVNNGNKQDTKTPLATCQFAPAGEYRTECLGGAVQDMFWDPSGKDIALSFCKLLQDSQERNRCFEIIILRASEVLAKKDYETFCRQIPTDISSTCVKQNTTVNTSQKNSQKNAPSPTNTQANTTTILMKDNDYEPKNLTIKKMTKISFKNMAKEARWPASNIHPTHLIYPEFDPQKPVKSGEVWEFSFNKVGIWKFHDHLIPSIVGTITVVE